MGVAPLLHLDVTEVYIRCFGDDAEGHQDIVLLYILESVRYGLGKEGFVPDVQVPRGGYHHGLRVPGKKGIASKSHTRGRFATDGFHQQILLGKSGENFPGGLGKTIQGYDQNVVFRKETVESVIGHFELLGRSRAVGHNDAISVFVHKVLHIHGDPGLGEVTDNGFFSVKQDGHNVEENLFSLHLLFVQILAGGGRYPLLFHLVNLV